MPRKPLHNQDEATKAKNEFHDFKVRAIDDFATFIDLIKFRGGMKNFGKVHKELVDKVTAHVVGGKDIVRFLTLMPRGHLKSTLMSQALPLWLIYRNPNIRIFLDCNSGALARRNLRVIDTYLRDETLQKTVWNDRPHIKGKLIPDFDRGGFKTWRVSKQVDEGVIKKIVWNVYSKQVIRPNMSLGEPTITCGSLGSAVTGWHFDVYIPDDLVDRNNSRTEKMRDKIEEHLAEIESVLDPYNPEEKFGNWIFMLGTRYYREDAYGMRLLDTETWDVFKRNIYANGVDYTDGTLWPERFTVEYLERKRRSLYRMGKSKEWFSQYLNQIVDDEKAVFKRGDFRYFDEKALVKTPRGWELRRTNGKPNIWLRPVMAVDWAFTDNTRSDFNAVIVLAIDYEGRVFVLDEYIRKCTPDKIYPAMLRMAEYWGCYIIGMESIRAWEAIYGFKKYMNDKKFWKGKKFPLTAIQTKAKKNVKIESTLCPYYKGGMVIHNKKIQEGTLEQQLCAYPEDKDDGPDSLAMAVQLALKPVRPPKPQKNTPRGTSIMSIVGGTR